MPQLRAVVALGAFARTLDPMDEATTRNLELVNYGFVVGALLIVVLMPRTRRSRVKPVNLVPSEQQA